MVSLLSSQTATFSIRYKPNPISINFKLNMSIKVKSCANCLEDFHIFKNKVFTLVFRNRWIVANARKYSAQTAQDTKFSFQDMEKK